MSDLDTTRQPRIKNVSDHAADCQPTLVMMPFLGGSWREWKQIMTLLEGRFHCVGLDLPGFGGAAHIEGYSVQDMAAYVEGELSEMALGNVVLVGHSMAGKVSMVVASRATEKPWLHGSLEGLVLVAPSTPSPEPMSDGKRADMISKLGKPAPNYRDNAAKYIRENTQEALPEPAFDGAVDDVLRMNPAAWRAWLESGSREDYAARVGELPVPALVIAGETDDNLGAAAQIKLTLPHLRSARLEVIPGAKHLIPMEQPEALAARIAEFVYQLSATAAPALDINYTRLIHSDRVSSRTKDGLLERLPDDPRYLPSVLTSAEMTTLREIAGQIIPLEGQPIDFAQRVDRKLATGVGQGWRYAMLPNDADAWKLGLQSVEAYCRLRFGLPFVALKKEQKRKVLEAAAAGDLEPRLLDKALHPLRAAQEVAGTQVMDVQQMQRWFGDVRAELTSLYVSHPATLAEMGYSGIADGADAQHLSGFVKLGLGESESWEPLPTTEKQI